jgi:putative transposase
VRRHARGRHGRGRCLWTGSASVTERREVTAQGYKRFRCRGCRRQFNERSGGVLNRTSFPSDIISFVVFCRLRYRLTLRDLSEILLIRGFIVSHEAVRDWETKLKLLPILGDALRKRRRGTQRGAGSSWYVDETYLKVRGRWCYLYRAIDRDGNLIDAMLSEQRDMRAAKAFFRSAKAIMGFRPDRVTTDGHGSYPRAIRTVLGKTVRHRTRVYLNNRLEQDHRGIKGRTRCMRGFKSPDAASRFCCEHGELEISFVPAVVTTRLSLPPSAAPVLSRPLRLRSTSCASPKRPGPYVCGDTAWHQT